MNAQAKFPTPLEKKACKSALVPIDIRAPNPWALCRKHQYSQLHLDDALSMALAMPCGTVLASYTCSTAPLSSNSQDRLDYRWRFGPSWLLTVSRAGYPFVCDGMGTNFSLWTRLVNQPLLIRLPFVFAVVWGPSRTWRGSMETSGRSWNPTSRWSFSTNQHAQLHLSRTIPYRSSPCYSRLPAAAATGSWPCCDCNQA